MNINNKIIKSALIVATLSSLVACGKDKENKSTVQAKVHMYQQMKVLKGEVTDAKGPVLEGLIQVKDSKGNVVASTELNNSRHYRVEIPAGTVLPIMLSVKSDKLTSPLLAVVISPVISKYDISTLTTKISKRAKELGGYTHSNMILAADSTIGVLESNKTSTGFRGDPTKQYGGWH